MVTIKLKRVFTLGRGKELYLGVGYWGASVASSKIIVLTWVIVKMIRALKESIKPYICVFYCICALKQKNFKESFCGTIQEQVSSLTTWY